MEPAAATLKVAVNSRRLSGLCLSGIISSLEKLQNASVVRNSRTSVTGHISIEHRRHDSDPFTGFRIDLNRHPITALTPRFILGKKLDGLPLRDDSFNHVFIKLAFGQQFHVQL